MNQTWRIIAKKVSWLILIFWSKMWYFGNLRSFLDIWVHFELFLSQKCLPWRLKRIYFGHFWEKIEFLSFLFLRLHLRLKLTYFRSIWATLDILSKLSGFMDPLSEFSNIFQKRFWAFLDFNLTKPIFWVKSESF